MWYAYFMLGFFLGIWISCFFLNRYYRSDVWEAKRRVILSELHAQEQEHEARAAEHRAYADEAMRIRTGNGSK